MRSKHRHLPIEGATGQGILDAFLVTYETFETFAEASLADWSAEERCGKRLTRNIGAVGIEFRKLLAIG
jgi:hypothetical protein